MKINGVNKANLKLYNQQLQKDIQPKKSNAKNDHLQISNEALQLQDTNKSNTERLDKVKHVKALIDSGNYEINASQIADKMINFWSSHS